MPKTVTLLALSCLLFDCTRTPQQAVPAKPEPSPVVVLGLDGLSFDILDPMLETNRLPTFATLVKNGARAVLMSENPMRSPALWTTIATGQPRAKHGIYDFVTKSAYWPKHMRGESPGDLVTSAMRKSPALWQFATTKKKSSLVVGWLNTWPAEPIDGLMVAPYVALGSKKQTSIKGRIYKDAAEQTYPRDAFSSLAEHVVDTADITPTQIRALLDPPPGDSPLYEQIPQLKRYMYTARWSIASALTNVSIIEDNLRTNHHDLVMTYFDGADTLGHRFWIMREPEQKIRARLVAHGFDPNLAPELKRRFGKVLEGYYEFIDGVLARVIKAAGPNATIVVVSDHGWGSSDLVQAMHQHVPFEGEHRLEGLFLASGPYIKKGVRLAPLNLYHIAPTVLYAMNLPIPNDLPGTIAREAFSGSYREAVAAVRATYKTKRSQAPVTPAHFEDSEIERLKSLGYVQ